MIENRQRRVAAISSAQTVLSPAHVNKQHVDLINDVVVRVLSGTGLTIKDVDFVIDSGSDFLDGRSISNCGFLGAMGANFKEESRVEEDGLWALAYGVNKIRSGKSSVGLIIAYSKPSESDPNSFWNGLLEPFLQRPVGLSHETALALYAQQYLAVANLKSEDLALVSARARSRADVNPYVAVAETDDLNGEEIVSTPLRKTDYSKLADGAVAILVVSEEVAENIDANPVWVTGHGSSIAPHMFTSREGDALPAVEYAVQGALNMSGRESAADYDIVEVSATSTVGELMVLEGLGLAEKYRGIELYREDNAKINPSGGALPADPIMATGLVRVHEALIRLTGREGHDNTNAKSALVHGTGGFAMQNHCVVTLEVA